MNTFTSIDVETGTEQQAAPGDVLLCTVYLWGCPFHAFAVRVNEDPDANQHAECDPYERLADLFEFDDPQAAYVTIPGSKLGGEAIPDAQYVVWLVPHGQ